jgi:hypothetical protein
MKSNYTPFEFSQAFKSDSLSTDYLQESRDRIFLDPGVHVTPEPIQSHLHTSKNAFSIPDMVPTEAKNLGSHSTWKCNECGVKESETPLKRKGPDGKRVVSFYN